MVDKKMSIGEVLTMDRNTAAIMMSFGMGCLGCAAAHFENIGQGAAAHGIDIDALVDALNKVAVEA